MESEHPSSSSTDHGSKAEPGSYTSDGAQSTWHFAARVGFQAELVGTFCWSRRGPLKAYEHLNPPNPKNPSRTNHVSIQVRIIGISRFFIGQRNNLKRDCRNVLLQLEKCYVNLRTLRPSTPEPPKLLQSPKAPNPKPPNPKLPNPENP